MATTWQFIVAGGDMELQGRTIRVINIDMNVVIAGDGAGDFAVVSPGWAGLAVRREGRPWCLTWF